MDESLHRTVTGRLKADANVTPEAARLVPEALGAPAPPDDQPAAQAYIKS